MYAWIEHKRFVLFSWKKMKIERQEENLSINRKICEIPQVTPKI